MIVFQDEGDRSVLFRYLSLAALSVVSFSYLLAATQLVGLSPKLRDVSIFAILGLIAAPLCGLFLTRKNAGSPAASIGAPAILVATAGLATLTVIQWLISFAPDPKAAWALWASRLSLTVPLFHIFVVLTWRRTVDRFDLSERSIGAFLNSAFAVAAGVSVVFLFWFDPGTQASNGFVALIRSTPFAKAGAGFVTASFAAAVVFLGLVVLAVMLDRALSREPRLQTAVGAFLLAASILIAGCMLFDFSLLLEPLHYLTNVGPAMTVRHGGTPLVEAYSQYGPGPVILSFLAYKIGPQTLSTAQILVQFCNIAFYAIWLACLYRMTRFKAAALALGMLAIALQLAAWDFGSGNINVAPSILGLRYLPSILLVLGLNIMSEGRHQNWLSSLAILISAVWSIETLISTVAVLLGYLAAINVRDRSPGRFVVESLFVALLLLTSFAILSAVTWWRASEAPMFGIYARFFTVYNPISDFWSFNANSHFFGWMIPLGTLFVVVGEVARRSVLGLAGTVKNCAGVDPLFYRFLPMAILAMQMGAYFAFRSYDYTVSTALLPVLAIIIPTAITLSLQFVNFGWPGRLSLSGIVVLVLISATFAFVALGRPGGPYSFYLQQCRDLNRCSPVKLLEALRQNARQLDVLEQTGNPLSDRYISSINPDHLLSDAVHAATNNSPANARVTFLLGSVIGSDLATLYSDRGRHFPISFSYTDQLVPELAERIIMKADFGDADGGIIVIRSDLILTPFETRMWESIRANAELCEINGGTGTVRVYRISPLLTDRAAADVTGCKAGS